MNKLDVLRRFIYLFTTAQLYKGLIRPCMEYGSHVWGSSTHTALLDRVELQSIHLPSSRPLTDTLQSFIFAAVLRHFLFCRYYNGHSFPDLSRCNAPSRLRELITRENLPSFIIFLSDCVMHNLLCNWCFLEQYTPPSICPRDCDLLSFKHIFVSASPTYRCMILAFCYRTVCFHES